jgi:hypothetical protein
MIDKLTNRSNVFEVTKVGLKLRSEIEHPLCPSIYQDGGEERNRTELSKATIEPVID